MLKQSSKNFKEFFLLEFTKELIRNTSPYQKLRIKKEVIELIRERPIIQKVPQKILLKKEILHGAVKEKIKRDTEIISYLKKEEVSPELKKYSFKKQPLPKVLPSYKISAPLEIPISKFPETVQHLKPTIGSRTINLGKLDPLIKDPSVKIIECKGSNERVIVMGKMGRKSTKIILTKEEIDEIIKRFSDATKIPIHEGIFRVAFGGLFFSTIVSQIISSKFMIRKISNIR